MRTQSECHTSAFVHVQIAGDGGQHIFGVVQLHHRIGLSGTPDGEGDGGGAQHLLLLCVETEVKIGGIAICAEGIAFDTFDRDRVACCAGNTQGLGRNGLRGIFAFQLHAEVHDGVARGAGGVVGQIRAWLFVGEER